ncbi:MAG: hypothetical protein KJZ86_10805 [Caldilineaceae bacterium]|nr:hypothetical protein [Caldilineaceae bacterium]
MNTLVITIADNTLRNLEQKSQSTGKSSAQIAADLVEDVFGVTTNGGSPHSDIDREEQKIIRDCLQEAGLIVRMGDSLRRQIRYDVTLSEVVDILAEAGGPSLSEIVDEQRGPKG